MEVRTYSRSEPERKYIGNLLLDFKSKAEAFGAFGQNDNDSVFRSRYDRSLNLAEKYFGIQPRLETSATDFKFTAWNS